MSGKLNKVRELTGIVEGIAITAQGMLEESRRLSAMKKNNAPEFTRMEEAMEQVSAIGGEDSPEKIEECLKDLEQAALVYQKHVDDDFMKRVSPIGKERRRFAADSASFASRMREKFLTAAKGLEARKGIQKQIAEAEYERNAANPLVKTISVEELGSKAAGKNGKTALKEKAAEKGEKAAKGGKNAGNRVGRKVERPQGKDKENIKKQLVSPISLQKVFGNDRFNQEFRAAVAQDATPEDLTDEELMEFLCDAMDQCFEHCREEEVDELEEIADVLGLKVKHLDPDVVLREEKEKALRQEMTKEPGLKK